MTYPIFVAGIPPVLVFHMICVIFVQTTRVHVLHVPSFQDSPESLGVSITSWVTWSVCPFSDRRAARGRCVPVLPSASRYYLLRSASVLINTLTPRISVHQTIFGAAFSLNYINLRLHCKLASSRRGICIFLRRLGLPSAVYIFSFVW
jgi:hypothetical protein